MTSRDEHIYREASALWRELYDEPPPVAADGAALLDAITRRLPGRSYDRLQSGHLRSAAIARPGEVRRGS